MNRLVAPPPQSREQSAPSKRINWIDWAKALGIYLIVTGHSHHNSAHVVPMLFMIHVPLFFVVSGYLFKPERDSLRQLAVSSLRSLVVPYFLYNLLASLYWLALGVAKAGLGLPYDWVGCVVTPAVNCVLGYSQGTFDGPTWFLLALVWCKLFCWLAHRGSRFVRYAVLLLWMALLYVRTRTAIGFPYCFDCGLAGFIWFEAGRLWKSYSSRMPRVSRIGRVAAVVAGFAVCWWVYRQNGMCNYILSHPNGLLGILGTGAGLVAYFSLCQLLDGIRLRIVGRVSAASIVVMCLHMPVQSVLENFVHYQGPELLTFVVDFALVLCLSALFPWMKRHVPVLLGGR